MEKRERKIITSCILIVAMIVCLFSDTIFTPDTVYAYTEKTGVIDVDAGSALNVRNGVGTSGTKILGTLAAGVTVTITGEANANDGSLWYKINYNGSAGYVSAKYVSDVQDKIDYAEDTDFEAYLEAQGFPESYKEALRELHAKYPKWVFVADHLDYSWDTALTNQSVVGRSLIAKDSISSWKSLETGSYNWSTGTWYTFDGGSWCAASKELVAYYMDPRNFLDETYIWMFEQLSYQSDIQTVDKLENILTGTFMQAGKNLVVNDVTGEESNYADIIMIAAEKSGVSPYHLAASMLVELGNDGASGSISGTYPGYEGYYNYYNWKAYAHSGRTAIENGLIYASGQDSSVSYLRPWNTRYKSIIGGAIQLGLNYINIGQNTLYYKKFDYVGTPYTHQYMTHVRAPEIEAQKTAKAYTTDVKENTAIVFKIPVYKNMPETACPIPTSTGSPNNCLASLSVKGQSLTPTFDKFTTEYSLVVENSVSSIEVNATAILSSTVVKGTGSYNLKEGSNTITISATAENGSTREYTLTVVRKAKETTSNNGTTTTAKPTTTTKPTTTAPTTTTGQTTTEEETTTAQTASKVTVKTSLNKDDSAYTISGIQPGTQVTDLKKNITVTNGTADVQTSAGKAKTSGKICTGDKVVVKDSNGKVVYTYNTIIYGDVNGDGNASIKDLLIIKKQLLGVTTLKDVYLKAGNVNRDSSGVTIKDILVLQKYSLGVSDIKQN